MVILFIVNTGLVSGCRWISSLDVHPSGDHLIVGSLDRRMIWFDLDLSNTPYKTLKYVMNDVPCLLSSF